MKSLWLMYHDVVQDVGATGAPASAAGYHVSDRAFSDQLDAVTASGLPVVGTSASSDARAGDAIVLTFDDGWLGSFETALPLLTERGLTATYYITKDFVGRRGFCTETSIVDAAAAGMEIGVHGTTHRLLAGCATADILHELRVCKEYLESLVQRPVVAASVPGGAWSRTVAACAAEVGLTSLSTSRPGINTETTPPLQLRRVAIRADTSAEDVARYCRFDVRRETVRWSALQVPRRVLGMQRYTRLRRRLLGDDRRDGVLFEP